MVIEPLASTLSITHRIREILGDDFRQEMPSFEELTGLLNMSARTLRRRLEKEGTSYQRIKDNARRDVAISMLSRDGSRSARWPNRWVSPTPAPFTARSRSGRDSRLAATANQDNCWSRNSTMSSCGTSRDSCGLRRVVLELPGVLFRLPSAARAAISR